MKEELIMKVKPETLDSLMNALVDITGEMKAAAPNLENIKSIDPLLYS